MQNEEMQWMQERINEIRQELDKCNDHQSQTEQNLSWSDYIDLAVEYEALTNALYDAMFRNASHND